MDGQVRETLAMLYGCLAYINTLYFEQRKNGGLRADKTAPNKAIAPGHAVTHFLPATVGNQKDNTRKHRYHQEKLPTHQQGRNKSHQGNRQ